MPPPKAPKAPPEKPPLLVDSRVGSKELYIPLVRLGVRAILSKLDFGDFSFVGNGPAGEFLIGIERKVLTDYVSSMRQNRISARQAGGMIETYDMRFLLLEGQWKVGDGGLVHWINKWGRWELAAPGGSRPVHHGEMIGFLASLNGMAGFQLIPSTDEKTTAYWLANLYNYWTKPWHAHNSLGIGGVGGALKGHNGLGKVTLKRPSFAWMLAAQMPGLGAEKARRAAMYFKSGENLASGTVDQWLAVKGEKGQRLFTKEQAEMFVKLWKART